MAKSQNRGRVTVQNRGGSQVAGGATATEDENRVEDQEFEETEGSEDEDESEETGDTVSTLNIPDPSPDAMNFLRELSDLKKKGFIEKNQKTGSGRYAAPNLLPILARHQIAVPPKTVLEECIPYLKGLKNPEKWLEYMDKNRNKWVRKSRFSEKIAAELDL